jgi:hypothetical protein
MIVNAQNMVHRSKYMEQAERRMVAGTREKKCNIHKLRNITAFFFELKFRKKQFSLILPPRCGGQAKKGLALISHAQRLVAFNAEPRSRR